MVVEDWMQIHNLDWDEVVFVDDDPKHVSYADKQGNQEGLDQILAPGHAIVHDHEYAFSDPNCPTDTYRVVEELLGLVAPDEGEEGEEGNE